MTFSAATSSQDASQGPTWRAVAEALIQLLIEPPPAIQTPDFALPEAVSPEDPDDENAGETDDEVPVFNLDEVPLEVPVNLDPITEALDAIGELLGF